jgi:hypothetical protein
VSCITGQPHGLQRSKPHTVKQAYMGVALAAARVATVHGSSDSGIQHKQWPAWYLMMLITAAPCCPAFGQPLVNL